MLFCRNLVTLTIIWKMLPLIGLGIKPVWVLLCECNTFRKVIASFWSFTVVLFPSHLLDAYTWRRCYLIGEADAHNSPLSNIMLFQGDLVHCPSLGQLEILHNHLLGNTQVHTPLYSLLTVVYRGQWFGLHNLRFWFHHTGSTSEAWSISIRRHQASQWYLPNPDLLRSASTCSPIPLSRHRLAFTFDAMARWICIQGWRKPWCRPYAG